MKRACSLFLLFLMIFNAIGYYGVLIFMECQLSDDMTEHLDANAAEMSGDLMLTFPLEVYAPDSESYERTDGQVNYEGEVYRLIKQKRYHGILYVICAKDENSTQVRKAMGEYSKTFTNQQPDNNRGPVKLVVSFAKYFLNTNLKALPNNAGWSETLSYFYCATVYRLFDHEAVFHPPQFS